MRNKLVSARQAAVLTGNRNFEDRIHAWVNGCCRTSPLQFKDRESVEALGLRGDESFAISGLADGIEPRQSAIASATRKNGAQTRFETAMRVGAPTGVEYVVDDGILDMLRLQSPSHSPCCRPMRGEEGEV